jgi:hypothetical protein
MEESGCHIIRYKDSKMHCRTPERYSDQLNRIIGMMQAKKQLIASADHKKV